MYEVGTAALGSRPVTLDALPLLQDTAEDDTDGEEEQSSSDASWWIVVLYPAPTVGAIVPAIRLSTSSDFLGRRTFL